MEDAWSQEYVQRGNFHNRSFDSVVGRRVLRPPRSRVASSFLVALGCRVV